MNTLNRYLGLMILSFLPVKTLGDPSWPQKTPDGRFGTSCYSFENQEACEVPFTRLLATPERYDGKIIRVTGFLINIYGAPVLFANKSSFDSGADIEGIVLRGAKIPKGMQKRIHSGIWPVYIVGRFNARFDNDDKISRLGMIEDLLVIRAL